MLFPAVVVLYIILCVTEDFVNGDCIMSFLELS